MKKKEKNVKNDLLWSFQHCGKSKKIKEDKIQKFAEGYKEFLDKAKTEREFVEYTLSVIKDFGYKQFDSSVKYEAGDKVFFVNRKKSLILATIGSLPLENGLHMAISHVDSPRLDLKPFPALEKSDIAYLKTHYYGGIRKYQWVTIPLALHGVVCKKDGQVVNVCIGEDKNDPVFCVTDLLPHLGAEQNERKLKDGIKGEELNAISATIPFVDDDDEDIKNAVKLKMLKLLNDKYGMTEKDFLTAELCFVPAINARDVGVDRSLVGAYGQDDRVCAYAALRAELSSKKPAFTTLTVFADKEEIGSYGNTGMNSDFTLHFIEDLAKLFNANLNTVLRNSYAISTDVGAAFDPNYPSVFDEQNSCHINKGCVLTKYTGARGKSGSNDASAETLSYLTRIFDSADVCWQIGEIGAVDVGGGGTVALYIASFDVNVVDLGVPILSMHSPFELSSKLDLYSLYEAVKAFYETEKIAPDNF